MGSEQTQAKYLALIQEGDKKAAAFDYENAISSYEQALVVKPNDSEATRKIAEAKAQIEQRAQADVNMKYAKWIEQATQAFNQKQYEIAKNFYTEALKTTLCLNPLLFDSSPEADLLFLRQSGLLPFEPLQF